MRDRRPASARPAQGSRRRPRATPRRCGAAAAALAATLATGLLAGCVGAAGRDERPEILVFAAASLSDVLSEIAATFERERGIGVVFSFAGSGFLARQIESSRAGDVFISADDLWMDRLEARGLLEPGSRRAVVSNRLVVVGHPRTRVRLSRLQDLATARFRHLVVGDPDAVPAGRYARETLRAVRVDGRDLWELLDERVVPTLDVRAALGLVQATPGAVGIVYGSDLAAGAAVRPLLEVPRELTPPILYVAAALAERSRPSAAHAFLDSLDTAPSRAAFVRHGFSLPE